MIAREPAEMRAVLEELANAIQGAVGLAALLRHEAQASETAAALEAAVQRAAAALRRLQPTRGGRI